MLGMLATLTMLTMLGMLATLTMLTMLGMLTTLTMLRMQIVQTMPPWIMHPWVECGLHSNAKEGLHRPALAVWLGMGRQVLF